MYDLAHFIKKHRHTILFAILELLATSLIVRGYYYHNIQFINSTNYVTGIFHDIQGFFNNQFHLESENQRLIKENIDLRKKTDQLEQLLAQDTTHYKIANADSISRQEYEYISAKVLHNSVNRNQNYLTLNKGLEDGVKKDMSVITDRGIIGVIENVSNHYAVVKSILDYKVSITGANVKNKNAFGMLVWEEKDFRFINLRKIPKYKKIVKGDVVLTTNASGIYPSGIPIGKIIALNTDKSTEEYIAKIALFQNFSAISNVYIVNEIHKTDFSQMLNDSIKTHVED